MHVVCVLSKFMVDHGCTHWKTLKWVLRYVNEQYHLD